MLPPCCHSPMDFFFILIKCPSLSLIFKSLGRYLFMTRLPRALYIPATSPSLDTCIRNMFSPSVAFLFDVAMMVFDERKS